jgi:hypothetical protein
MLPAVSEALEALKTRMSETIIPALPSEAAFEHEQAGLMLATLDWLIDVQSKNYLYEVVEHEEYLRLLESFCEVIGDDDDGRETVQQAREVIGSATRVSSADLVDLDDLASRTRQLKSLAGELFAIIAVRSGAESLRNARQTLATVAQRQERRDKAFYRMTGFIADPEDLGSVLKDQSRSR